MRIAIDRESVNNILRTVSTVVLILVSLIAILIIMFSSPAAYRIPFAGALFLVSVFVAIFTFIRNGKENKKIEALLEILYKECNAEKFIAESEALISKTKTKRFLTSLRLNLALGYEAIEKPAKAIVVTKKANIKATDKISWAIYYNNLAMFYAELDDSDNAANSLKIAEKYMKKAKKYLPEENFLLTKGMVAFSEGEYKTAKSMFDDAKKIGFTNKHSVYLNELYIGKTLFKIGKEKEAKATLKRVSQKKTLPYITKAALEELNNIETI